ncbi:MAG TPA: tripartite tricarboxylate transporter substrate binding protein [Xanthobacteraceae bacterium]|nr:tripartite tricarboxylate transporter substrate binding protein [Xanthobacteraceae bacterium]
MKRRTFLRLAAYAAALPMPRIAQAQTYPTRPVRLIVGIAAGGTQDTIARLLAQGLSERLGQQFVVDNRPGANGNLATEAVVRAAPDGYTLILANTSNSINATLYEKLSYDFIRDIAPVGSIGRGNGVMLVTPSFPAKDIPEFIAYAKANPGTINMASGGVGNITHMSGELFAQVAGIKLVHVPYRGEALSYPDLLSGRMQVLFGGIPPALEHVRTGRLRALGVTIKERSKVLPDVPSISEFLPSYEASAWYGIGAPKATPADVINKLNQAMNAIINDPKLGAQFTDLGVLTGTSSPSQFASFIAAETEKWAKVIRTAGIKPE